jgi:hypothetical protein
MADVTYVSLGWRCLTPSILNQLGLRNKAFPFDWLRIHDVEVFHSIVANRYETFIGAENWFAVPENMDGVEVEVLYSKHHPGLIMSHPTDQETRARRVERLRDALAGDRVIFVRFEIHPNARTLRLAGSLARRMQAPILLIYPPDCANVEDRPNPEEEARLAEAGEVLVVRAPGPATMEEYGSIYDVAGDVTGLDWRDVFDAGGVLRERFERRSHQFVMDEETRLAELTVDQLIPQDFDCAMYRAINPDIPPHWDLKLHYVAFGRVDKRLYHLRDAPPDFVPDTYKCLNPDLATLAPEAATAHYIIYGRGEGRMYK